MLADASDGVASLGPLIKLGVVAFVVLAVFAVFIDGSNINLIRRAREQRRSDAAVPETDQVTGSDEG